MAQSHCRVVWEMKMKMEACLPENFYTDFDAAW